MKLDVDFDEKREIPVGETGRVRFRFRDIAVEPGKAVSLKKDFDPDFTGGYDDKAGALEQVATNVERLSAMQEILYAQDNYALLIIFQAMDAAGKDGAIRHVMSGINPQGCQVTSFKAPSAEDLDYGYLWRASKALPGRGMIGIFNRSYYEDVLSSGFTRTCLKSKSFRRTRAKKIFGRNVSRKSTILRDTLGKTGQSS